MRALVVLSIRSPHPFPLPRHAIVDLALVLHTSPREPESSRLPKADLAALRAMLTAEGLQLHQGPDVDKRLEELRGQYEPYIYAISRYLMLTLPPWIMESGPLDNWQISAWGQSVGFRKTGRGGKHDCRAFLITPGGLDTLIWRGHPLKGTVSNSSAFKG